MMFFLGCSYRFLALVVYISTAPSSEIVLIILSIPTIFSTNHKVGDRWENSEISRFQKKRQRRKENSERYF